MKTSGKLAGPRQPARNQVQAPERLLIRRARRVRSVGGNQEGTDRDGRDVSWLRELVKIFAKLLLTGGVTGTITHLLPMAAVPPITPYLVVASLGILLTYWGYRR